MAQLLTMRELAAKWVAAMSTGTGFGELYDGTPCDLDGRIIE